MQETHMHSTKEPFASGRSRWGRVAVGVAFAATLAVSCGRPPAAEEPAAGDTTEGAGGMGRGAGHRDGGYPDGAGGRSGGPGAADAAAGGARSPRDRPDAGGGSRGSSAPGLDAHDAEGAPDAAAPDTGTVADATAAADAQPLAPTMHWVVYGDTRTNPGTHQTVVNAFAKLNPQLVIHSGDLWAMYPGGPSQWTGILTKNPGIASLLQQNLFLVAQGNHESADEVTSFKPPIVRDNATEYSFSRGNAFFVVLGMDPSSVARVAYLQQQLASAPAKAATWRFVVSHYPVYSGGHHPNSGFPQLEKVCDEGHVTLFFNGHDHDYQRSYQLFGGKAVDMSDTLSAAKGTVYAVTGGGGAPLYQVAKIPGVTKVAQSIQHFMEVTSDSNQVAVKTWDINGKMIDSFSIGH
jgi:hypothetical protein